MRLIALLTGSSRAATTTTTCPVPIIVVFILVIVVVQHGMYLGSRALASIHLDEPGWPFRDTTADRGAADAATTAHRRWRYSVWRGCRLWGFLRQWHLWRSARFMVNVRRLAGNIVARWLRLLLMLMLIVVVVTTWVVVARILLMSGSSRRNLRVGTLAICSRGLLRLSLRLLVNLLLLRLLMGIGLGRGKVIVSRCLPILGTLLRSITLLLLLRR